jgi:hypothetical protein
MGRSRGPSAAPVIRSLLDGGRQSNGYKRSAAWSFVDGNGAAVRRNDLSHNSQPQPSATTIARPVGIDTDETIES